MSVRWHEIAEQLAKDAQPREGQIYFNPKRGNCLRVLRIYDVSIGADKIRTAQCQSFRPDGDKGSLPINVKVSSFRNYLRVTSITVQTGFGRYEWQDFKGKGEWKAE